VSESNYSFGEIKFSLPEPLVDEPYTVDSFMSKAMFERVKQTILQKQMGPDGPLKYHTMIGRWDSSVSFDEDIEKFFLEQARTHFNNSKLVKAYFFACRYQIKDGCIPNLWEHTDQNGTQTTIDICIENTAEWGLTVENKFFEHKPNEAIIFAGQQHHHARPPYPTRDESKYTTVLFLHYTDPTHWIQTEAKGFRKYGGDGDVRFFNRNRYAPMPDPPVNQSICSCHDYANVLNLYDEICGKDYDKNPELSILNISEKKELAPGIMLYSSNSTSSRVIKGLVQNSMFKQWKQAEVLVDNKPAVNSNARNCFNFFLDKLQDDCHPQDPIVRAKKSIENGVDAAVLDFSQRYSIKNLISKHTVLLRYEQDNMFHDHFDHASMYPRIVSASLFLNDDFEGGEFVFKEFNLTIKPKTGDILVFSSSFPYMHRVNPVKTGIRYAAVKWYEYP